MLKFIAIVILVIFRKSSQLDSEHYYFKRIELRQEPTLLSTLNIVNHYHCAMACSEVRQIECSGFRVVGQVCDLFSGELLEKIGVGVGPAYSLQRIRLPRCSGPFEVHYHQPDKYCLAYSPPRLYYKSQILCNESATTMVFADNAVKLQVLAEAIGPLQIRDYWISGKYNSGTDQWESDLPGKAIKRSNSLWADGSPEADPSNTCTCLKHEDGRTRIHTSGCHRGKRSYCERFDYF